MLDWSRYPNFSKSEFDCKHTGKNDMQADFMARLQRLRTRFRQPMVISSGYRDPSHPLERNKANPGTHTMGRACDVAIQGAAAHTLLRLALEEGFTGIGIQQKGGGRFIHLDDLPSSARFPRPTIWSY